MALHRNQLPQLGGDLFLTYTGMETDLLFTQGVDLPGFASYPLLETESGRALLRSYLENLIDVGKACGAGVILESATWVANRDRGASIGYTPDMLKARNAQSIALMAEVRKAKGDVPTVLSANLGPRTDAYAPTEQMTCDEAEVYHTEQIETLAQTDVDMITGYTVAYIEEAIGMVQAARRFELPIVIAFTVETDGHLPTGTRLAEAIQAVDQATDEYASYFMINCAHPDHFATTLKGAGWLHRLRGIVANASRCSHADLDEATELDAGNPRELGQQLAVLYKTHPSISILGGCCGTDMRHMSEIAQAVRAR